jgi:hypothetical protein
VLANRNTHDGSETLMSRGPGRLQRAIRAAFEAEPDNAFLLSELCERVYRGINRIEKKHRVALARAARGIPELECWRRQTLGRELLILDPCNVMSYAMARLKSDNLGWYERNGDPRAGEWRRRHSEGDLRATLTPEGKNHSLIVPGGAWWRFVELARLRAAGKHERAAELDAQIQRELDAFAEGLRGIGGLFRRRRRRRPPIVGYRLATKGPDGKWHEQHFATRRAANKAARAMQRYTIIERIYGAPPSMGDGSLMTADRTPGKAPS